MTIVFALLLPLAPACQGWQAPDQAAPERAVWVEAEGVSTRPWLGWSGGGPRRESAPTQGPWLAIEFDVPAIPAAADGWLLELAGGAILRGGPGPDRADLGLPTWALSGPDGPRLPLDAVWLRRQGRSRLPLPGARETDLLWLRRPGGVLDLQRGFLLDWTAAGLDFEGPAGRRAHPWEQIETFDLLDEPMDLPADAVWLMLADGSTLLATVLAQDPRADGGAWRLGLPWGAEARLPARAVARLRRRAGVEEWAVLEWAAREPSPSSAVDWSPKRNRSVEGGLLRIGARVFPQGLGVRAPCEVARAVPGPGTFFATVGADAEALSFRQPQSAVFRVLLDDQELAVTPPLAAADGARPLLVAVPRAGLLRLRAEAHGDGPPHGAHADWCDLIWLAGE